jgi:hypothetical protein
MLHAAVQKRTSSAARWHTGSYRIETAPELRGSVAIPRR